MLAYVLEEAAKYMLPVAALANSAPRCAGALASIINGRTGLYLNAYGCFR